MGKTQTGGYIMFKQLLNPENSLMITMTQVTDCIFLSLFWLVCSFPVITVGASSAALYDAVYYGFRKGDKHPWTRFFRSFRSNLKGSFLPAAVYFAVLGAGGWAMIRLWNALAAGTVSGTVFSAGALLAMLVLGIISVIFPMLSRFENSTPVLLKNALLLALANLPRTLGLGVLNGLSIWLCARFVIPLFFLPALAALISTLCLEPMFKPYMPEETK